MWRTPRVEASINTNDSQTIIDDAIQKDVKFDYVNFDALYSMSFDLFTYLKTENIDFVGDIRSGCKLYFDHDKSESCKVAQFVSSLNQKEDFLEICIRDSSKGQLKAAFYWHDVQIKSPQTEELIDLKLLVRRDKCGKIKY